MTIRGWMIGVMGLAGLIVATQSGRFDGEPSWGNIVQGTLGLLAAFWCLSVLINES